jgi:hypothetical protein
MDRSHAKHTRAHGDGKKRRASKTNGERQRRRAHPDRDMVPRDGRRKTPIRAPTTHLRVDTSDGTTRTWTARRWIPPEQKGSEGLRRTGAATLQNQRTPGHASPSSTTAGGERDHEPLPHSVVRSNFGAFSRPTPAVPRRRHGPDQEQTKRRNFDLWGRFQRSNGRARRLRRRMRQIRTHAHQQGRKRATSDDGHAGHVLTGDVPPLPIRRLMAPPPLEKDAPARPPVHGNKRKKASEEVQICPHAGGFRPFFGPPAPLSLHPQRKTQDTTTGTERKGFWEQVREAIDKGRNPESG